MYMLPRKARPWKSAKVCLKGFEFQNLDFFIIILYYLFFEFRLVHGLKFKFK